MTRRTASHRLAVALAAVCLLLGAACAGGAAPAPPASAPSGAAGGAPAQASAPGPAAGPTAPIAPTRLTFAYSTTSSANSLVQLAQDQGIFRANGLEVEMVHAPGNAGPAALFAGQAQLLISGCSEAISAIAAGADLVYVLVNTNRMQYVLAGGPNVTSRAEITGKRFGVSRFGTSSPLATKFIMKQLGLDADRDVSYVQVGNTPERVSALLAGSIDGSVLTVEEGLIVGEMPGMRILVDMTKENLPYCGNGWFMQRDYARDNEEIIRRTARATVQATARYKTQKAEGVAAVVRFLGEDDPIRAERIWDIRSQMFPAKPYPEPRGLQFVLDEAGQDDERVRRITTQQLIDDRFVRELDQSGFIDSLYPGGVAPS